MSSRATSPEPVLHGTPTRERRTFNAIAKAENILGLLHIPVWNSLLLGPSPVSCFATSMQHLGPPHTLSADPPDASGRCPAGAEPLGPSRRPKSTSHPSAIHTWDPPESTGSMSAWGSMRSSMIIMMIMQAHTVSPSMTRPRHRSCRRNHSHAQVQELPELRMSGRSSIRNRRQSFPSLLS